MLVNAVDFTAARYPSITHGHKRSIPKVKRDNPLRPVDIIPVSGLLGAALMSVYFIKKGNLDIGMRVLHI